MVLTNFECWAHEGSDNLSVDTIERRGNTVDLFNPVVLQQTCISDVDQNSGAETDVKSVSHFSSNGYYGFVPCNIQNSVTSPASLACSALDNQMELVNNANSTRNNFGGENSVMDVEQEHMVFPCMLGGADGGVVNSMFLKEEPVLAQKKLWKNNECNRFWNDRRKRVFGSRSGGMEIAASKRLRISEEGCFLIEHGNTKEHQALSNEPQSKDNYAIDQLTSTTSFNDNGSLQTLNKRSQTNVKYVLNTNMENDIQTLEFKSDMMNSNFSKVIKPQTNILIHKGDISSSISNKLEAAIGLKISNKSNQQLQQTKPREINLYDKNDKLLEDIFLSLHGGSYSHMLRQLSKDHMSIDDL